MITMTATIASTAMIPLIIAIMESLISFSLPPSQPEAFLTSSETPDISHMLSAALTGVAVILVNPSKRARLVNIVIMSFFISYSFAIIVLLYIATSSAWRMRFEAKAVMVSDRPAMARPIRA